MCKCIMPVCSVKQCGARKSKNQPNLTLHRFPESEVLRGKWLNAIGSENINPRHKKELYVCSLHFEEGQFNRTLDVVRLRDNAVPRLFNTTSTSKQMQETPKENLDLVNQMPSTSKMEPALEVYEVGNAPEKFVSVMSQTKKVLAPPHKNEKITTRVKVFCKSLMPTTFYNALCEEKSVIHTEDINGSLIGNSLCTPILVCVSREQNDIFTEYILNPGQSISKHGAFEYRVNDVQEDLIPVPVLDKPKKIVTAAHILTSKDIPVSCKTIIYFQEHADRVMNFPDDDVVPAREAVNFDFSKVQKLERLCKEQRKKIKRLNEKIRRQGKKIRTLEELLSELEIFKIKDDH